MEQQNSKKLGLINSIVLLIVTIGALYFTLQTSSPVGLGSTSRIAPGTMTWTSDHNQLVRMRLLVGRPATTVFRSNTGEQGER